MIVGDTLFREKDCKPFTVTEIGHWFKVVSDDGDGENTLVKFLGTSELGETYVSINGTTFVLLSLK